MSAWKFFKQLPAVLKLIIFLQLLLLAILVYRSQLDMATSQSLISIFQALGDASKTASFKSQVVDLVAISGRKNWLMITEFLCLVLLWGATGRLLISFKKTDFKGV